MNINTDNKLKLAAIVHRASKIDTPSVSKKKNGPKMKQRRRNLSSYNYFMKYHRAITVMGEPTLLGGDSSRSQKRQHIDAILENDPYRLDNGKKRRHRKSHGVIGFRELTLQVATSWKELDAESKSIFEDLAKEAKLKQQVEDFVSDPDIIRSEADAPNTTRKKNRSRPRSSDEEKMALLEKALDVSIFALPSDDEATPTTQVSAPSSLQRRKPRNGINTPSLRKLWSTTNKVDYTDIDVGTYSFIPLKVESNTLDSCSSKMIGSGGSVYEPSPYDLNITNHELASFLSNLDWTLL